MAATAARTLLRNGKSPLPLFLRGKILSGSTIDVNLNTIPKDHQFLQSLFVSNQNSQALNLVFDSSEVGKVFSSFGGQSLAVQGENRRYASGDLQDNGVVEARGRQRRAVSDEDDSDDSDGDMIDEDLDEDFDDLPEDEDFDDFDDNDDEEEEEDNDVRKRKK
ncbi:hypothetical protein SLA2020_396100 [Shorea laevis]